MGRVLKCCKQLLCFSTEKEEGKNSAKKKRRKVCLLMCKVMITPAQTVQIIIIYESHNFGCAKAWSPHIKVIPEQSWLLHYYFSVYENYDSFFFLFFFSFFFVSVLLLSVINYDCYYCLRTVDFSVLRSVSIAPLAKGHLPCFSGSLLDEINLLFTVFTVVGVCVCVWWIKICVWCRKMSI